MDTVVVCGSVEELESVRSDLATEPGRVCLESLNAPAGVFGYSTFLKAPDEPGPGPHDEKVITLRFCPFGRPLAAAPDRVSGLGDLFESFSVHRSHDDLIWTQPDPFERTLGFVCYCEAASGTCHYPRIPLTSVIGHDRTGSEKEALDFVMRTQGGVALSGLAKVVAALRARPG